MMPIAAATIGSMTASNSHHPMSEAAPPTAVDLFSGCGGLSLGLLRAGFSVLAAGEIDPKAQESFARKQHFAPLRTLSVLQLNSTAQFNSAA
jgi:DNA (cytosine-5)-methyltransferase 1